jgi:hypothetical protein
MKAYPEMFLITKMLDHLRVPWTKSILLKTKSRFPPEVQKKGGPKKMKVHPDMFMITKGRKSDIWEYPEMSMKNQALTGFGPVDPEMLMLQKSVSWLQWAGISPSLA